jgi:hypothetical protein
VTTRDIEASVEMRASLNCARIVRQKFAPKNRNSINGLVLIQIFGLMQRGPTREIALRAIREASLSRSPWYSQDDERYAALRPQAIHFAARKFFHHQPARFSYCAAHRRDREADMCSTLARSHVAPGIWLAFRQTSRHLLQRATPARARIASLVSIAAMAVCAPQQTWAQLTYNYAGNEMTWQLAPPGGGDPGTVTATATFNIPSCYTGSPTPTAISLIAGGQTFSFTSAQFTGSEGAVFSNGNIITWLISTPGAATFNQPYEIVTENSGPGSAGDSDYGPGYEALSANNPGTWTLTSATPSPPPAPVAANESLSTPENTALTINLTAGASGNSTCAAFVGTAVGGSVTGFPGTTVTFTPTPGFTGIASFQFILANANGTSNTAMATIMVGSPPLSPPNISLNGNSITGPQHVVVGQIIQLMAMPGNEASQADPWEFDQNAITAITGGFNPTGCPSTAVNAWPPGCKGMEVPPLFTPSSAQFYWKIPTVTSTGTNITPSGTYRVSYQYTLADGSSGSVPVDFIVEGPTSPTITPSDPGLLRPVKLRGETDIAFWGLDQMWCFYAYAPNDYSCYPGITFTPKADLPSDYIGSFQWVQFITEYETTSIIGQSPISTTKDFLAGAPSALDNAFPSPVRIDDRQTRVPPAPDPVLQTTWADAPRLQLCPKYSQVTWTFSADMYLLWQAQTSKVTGKPVNGIYVTLGMVSWGFDGTAYHQPKFKTFGPSESL